MTEIEVTDLALQDLSELPKEVEDTFFNMIDTAEGNLGLGAAPNQVFEKYLSGDMHPLLQEKLGRDYRVWFIEGGRIDREEFEDGRIYCVRVLTKPQAEEIEASSRTVHEVLEPVLS